MQQHPDLVNISNHEIMLQWWHKTRKVSLYIDNGGSIFILRIWGPNIHTQMQELKIGDGIVDNLNNALEWLHE